MSILYETYETVIGLEIHVELLTKTKLFCACSTAFGGAPNSNTCPVCAGLPGSLPVLNRKAVEKCVMLGLALHSDIARCSWFDRKNYYYPDNPQNYQITQFYAPLCTGGYLETEKGKRIRIREMHLEDDAGKLLHRGSKTLIDYNRSGVPLIEIVTAPDFSSAEEAVQFLRKLREILLSLGISDCKMQEGSLRVDVNLSVKPAGAEENGVRAEIKNVNSFSELVPLAAFEKKRQVDLLAAGGRPVQETRGWDGRTQTTFFMRRKETPRDYRYFREPDLPALALTDADIAAIRAKMPKSADEIRQEMMERFGVSAAEAAALQKEPALYALFCETYGLRPDAKRILNRLLQEGTAILRQNGQAWEEVRMRAADFAALLELGASGRISLTTEKALLQRMFSESFDPVAYVRSHDLMQQTDEGKLKETAQQVVADNPSSVRDYLAGKDRALQYLTGQGMKALAGRADAKQLQDCIREVLKKGRNER